MHQKAVSYTQKLVSFERLEAWRNLQGYTHGNIVVTNGCFDLLHIGHVDYLERARREGDLLLVGINDDHSVTQLKGPARPVNLALHRAYVVAALESVDAVCIFSDRTAAHFLAVARPHTWVKGGDYNLDTIDQNERAVVEGGRGKIVFIPFSFNTSTTQLLNKVK